MVFCLNQAICLSPTFPFPSIGYIKPKKSSADGGIQNLKLPLLAPTVLALAAEYSLNASIPVFFSIISLNSLLNTLYLKD